MLCRGRAEGRAANEPILLLAEALRIGREIAEGVAPAHECDRIHHDIKPANVFLIGKACRVKILDFGLARATEAESRITQTGAILGSPGFMAPEQTRGEKTDFRSDLFALGVVLYRMCTGTHPFDAADALSAMIAIATKDPPPPQMRNFDLPIELCDLIMKLLEKDPAQRDISAQQVVETLQQIERELQGAVVAAPKRGNRAVPADTAAPRASAKGQKPLPWLLIGLAVGGEVLCLLLTLVIAGIVLFF